MKRILLGVLAMAVLWSSSVQSGDDPAVSLATDAELEQHQGATVLQSASQPPAKLSDWITYTRPNCCNQVGGFGPIFTELFVYTGPSLPVAGKTFDQTLKTGWLAEFGGRSLFFDRSMTAAWAVNLGISHTYNHGQRPDITVPFNGGTENLTIRELNRTYANIGVSREWYLGAPADVEGPKWRVGMSGGGRLGSFKIEFHEITHKTDLSTGVYLGLHADREIPWGCCTFLVGVRSEWDYIWNHLSGLDANLEMMDVNILLTLGVRF